MSNQYQYHIKVERGIALLRVCNLVKIRWCKAIWIFAPIQQGYWVNFYRTFFVIMFWFGSALYWTENKSFGVQRSAMFCFHALLTRYIIYKMTLGIFFTDLYLPRTYTWLYGISCTMHIHRNTTCCFLLRLLNVDWYALLVSHSLLTAEDFWFFVISTYNS